jgi:hypothetical protein
MLKRYRNTLHGTCFYFAFIRRANNTYVPRRPTFKDVTSSKAEDCGETDQPAVSARRDSQHNSLATGDALEGLSTLRVTELVQGGLTTAQLHVTGRRTTTNTQWTKTPVASHTKRNSGRGPTSFFPDEMALLFK